MKKPLNFSIPGTRLNPSFYVSNYPAPRLQPWNPRPPHELPHTATAPIKACLQQDHSQHLLLHNPRMSLSFPGGVQIQATLYPCV